MLIEIVAGAVVAGVAAGVIAARRWRRQRRGAGPEDGGAGRSAPKDSEHAATFAGLPVALGDVVQVGDDTRWLRSALLVRGEGRLRCALLLADEDGASVAVAAFPPPQRHILWLKPVSTTLPLSPPSRIELGGGLLEREASFPAEIETLGGGAPAIAAGAVCATYRGALGDGAVVVQTASETLCWHGPRIAAGDFDRLGKVDPDSDEIGAR